MYNTIGLIMIGTLIGCCLMTMLSVYMYRHSMIAEYEHNGDGVCWYLKEICTSTVDNNYVYVMQSTEDGHTEGMSQSRLSKEFTLKKKFKKF